MREQAEALLRLIGEDGVTRIIQGANRELDGMVGRQKASASASDAQSKSVLTLGERWSVISTGINSTLELGKKAFDLAIQAGEAIADGARGLVLDETFAANYRDAAAALEDLREASRGRISDNVLEQIAIDAQRAGLSLNATSDLVGAVVKASSVTGKPAADSMKELAKSIAEGTNEGFKQLGVFFDVNATLETYAKTIGKTTAGLTQADKSAALLAAGVEQLESKFQGVTGDAALARLDQVSARWDNMKDTLKEAAAVSFEFVASQIENIWNDTSGDGPNFEERLRLQYKTLEETSARLATINRQNEFRTEDLNAERAREREVLFSLLAEQEKAAQIQKQLDDEKAARAREMAELVTIYGSQERLALVESMQATRDNAEAAAYLALTRAELATQFGSEAMALDEWKAALSAADAAQIDFVASTDLITQAFRPLRDEMSLTRVETAALQAELAELAGDTAGAYALRSQAASLATGDDGSREVDKPTKSGGGGGGTKRNDAYYAKLVADASKAYEAQLRAGAEAITRIQADAALSAIEARNEADQLALDALVSRHEQELQLEQAHQAAIVESRRGGFDAAAEASRNLVSALGELDGIQMSNLPNTISQFGPLLEQIEALRAGTDKSQNAMVKGAAGIVGASGKMVAGLIKNETARAAVMSLVEIAEATRSFASYDYVGGALHMVAAGQYAAVAGMSAGGGGGRGGGGGGPRGRSAPELPASMQPQQQSAPSAPVAYNIFLSGATLMGGDGTTLGRDLVRHIQDSERRKTSGGAARDAAPR